MNYFNHNIIKNHDHITDMNNQWVQFYNFLLTLHFWDNYENHLVYDDLKASLIYDV